MRKIRCHHCQTEQSMARDVCSECGVFMRREACYLVGEAPTPERLQANRSPVTNPPPSPLPLPKTPAYLAGTPLAPDTQMICCHLCYTVQLAEENLCTKCQRIMDRAPRYLFPAIKITQPYRGRAPKGASNEVSNLKTQKLPTANDPGAEVITAFRPTASTSSATSPKAAPSIPQEAGIMGKTTNASQAHAPVAVPKTTPDNSAGQVPILRLCCHVCYAVQSPEHKICEKCGQLMRREPPYLFSAVAKR